MNLSNWFWTVWSRASRRTRLPKTARWRHTDASKLRNTFNGTKRPKFTSVAALVAEILKRHQIALRKTEIVNPEIAPITLRYE